MGKCHQDNVKSLGDNIMRLHTVILSRCLDDWTLETAKLAAKSDVLTIINGPIYGEPEINTAAYTPDEFENTANIPKLHVFRIHAFWKSISERINTSLHHGSAVWREWFLFLFENERFEVTEEFKSMLSEVEIMLPEATEILIPTKYIAENKVIATTLPVFTQRVMKFSEGLHVRGIDTFYNAQGINTHNEPALQRHRILPTDTTYCIENYRIDRYDEKYENWLATTTNLPLVTNDKMFLDQSQDIMGSYINKAPQLVTKVRMRG